MPLFPHKQSGNRDKGSQAEPPHLWPQGQGREGFQAQPLWDSYSNPCRREVFLFNPFTAGIRPRRNLALLQTLANTLA